MFLSPLGLLSGVSHGTLARYKYTPLVIKSLEQDFFSMACRMCQGFETLKVQGFPGFLSKVPAQVAKSWQQCRKSSQNHPQFGPGTRALARALAPGVIFATSSLSELVPGFPAIVQYILNSLSTQNL